LLFGQPVIAHLGIPSSIPTQRHNLSILLIYGCMDLMLFVIMARSSAYAAEFIIYCESDVLRLYPRFPRSNHLSSGSRNMMERYGLSASPCMILLCMCIGLFYQSAFRRILWMSWSRCCLLN
jgi:hypothetical protein